MAKFDFGEEIKESFAWGTDLINIRISRKQSQAKKIVFFNSDLQEEARFRLGEEFREIEKVISKAEKRNRFTINSHFVKSEKDLLRFLKEEEVSMVHFSGSNRDKLTSNWGFTREELDRVPNSIKLERESGDIYSLDQSSIKALFEPFEGKIECVFLNGCFSEEQAKEISKYVPYVIGIDNRLDEKMSLAFASAFYAAWTSEQDIASSFDLALANTDVGDIPTLIKRKQLYALLVGIDIYKPPVPPLDSCVNDIRAMEKYLSQKYLPTNQKIRVLENEQASRKAILENFQEFLGKARENDTALFFFSGHGSQAPSQKEGYKMSTLVAYDSRTKNGKDITDLELWKLIAAVKEKGAKVVMMLDCPNAGISNHWDILEVIWPRPKFIQLSACHAFELAKETSSGGSPRGVFTYSLIEILESSVGALSYQDLHRQVRTLVKKRTYAQSVELYCPDIDDLDNAFWGNQSVNAPDYISLSYDRESNEWSIDQGAVHGLLKDTNQEGEVICLVYWEGATKEEMGQESRALGRVSIKTVDAESSTVRLEGDLWLDKETYYRARLFQMPLSPIKIFLKGDDKGMREQLGSAFQEDLDAAIYLNLIEQEKGADYLVNIDDSAYTLWKGKERILALNEGHSVAKTKSLVKSVVHIAKWKAVLERKNPDSILPSNSIRMELFHSDVDVPINSASDGYTFEYQASDTSSSSSKIRVKLHNQGEQKLYVSLHYMSADFEIIPNLIATGGIWLNSGEECWALHGKPLNITLSDRHFQNEKKEVEVFLKLFYSTSEFDAFLLRMKDIGQLNSSPDLETQSNPSKESKNNQNMNLPLVFDDEEISSSLNYWDSDLVRILLEIT